MFGIKIKALREVKGISQRALGAYIEVDAAFISKIESGEKIMSRKHLPIISQVLDIEKAELLKLWLADKVYKIVKEEDFGQEVLNWQKIKSNI